MKTVMIDGMNLGIEKGTGISTYARNLSFELHEMGHRVEVLYSEKLPRGRKNVLLKEIAHFDAPQPPATFLEEWLQRFDRTRDFLRPTVVDSVEYTGRVITRAFSSRMPYVDRVWNVRDVFGQADWRFFLWGMAKKVKLPEAPDIAHWTYPIPLRIARAANVYTMHDLVPLRLPYTTLDKKSSYLRLARHLVKKADHIVTVSETSRRDIIELLDCPANKVTNTFQSVDIPKKFRDVSDEEVQRSVEGVFNLPYKEYFLFFGSLEPKKNIGRLIEAYLASKLDTPLVVVGARAWKSENELRLINDTTNRFLEQIGNVTVTRDKIRQFGYAPFPLLVNLIRGAKAVTFPSLYEGFGLPILEAMLLGTPVMTSTEGSTPEVAGDAALLVDPYDPRQISQALIELDTNAELRARLSAQGRIQAAKFSREAYRERLSQVYDKVLEKRGR